MYGKSCVAVQNNFVINAFISHNDTIGLSKEFDFIGVKMSERGLDFVINIVQGCVTCEFKSHVANFRHVLNRGFVIQRVKNDNCKKSDGTDNHKRHAHK